MRKRPGNPALCQHVSILLRNRDQPMRAIPVEKLTLAVFIARLKEITNRSASQLCEFIRLFQSEIVLRWLRELVRRKFTYPLKGRGGVRRLNREVEDLIVQVDKETPCWGYGKIQGELLKLGYVVSVSAVRKVRRRHPIQTKLARKGSESWRHLMAHCKEQILACDFFSVDTLWLKRLYVLFFIDLGPHQAHLTGITANPDIGWVTKQVRQLMGEFAESKPTIHFLIRDRDS
jgi:putative transposase